MSREPIDQKKAREYEQQLGFLTRGVHAYLKLLDRAMHKPSTEERGREIARLSNELEMANDKIRHFTLDIDLTTGNKRKVVK